MADPRDRSRLETILQLVGDVERRLGEMTAAQFSDDGDERDLTAFRLSAIGENANKLSPELKARHPELPWRDMYAFRTLISHEYALIVARFVWEAAHELDPIRAMCVAELVRFDSA